MLFFLGLLLGGISGGGTYLYTHDGGASLIVGIIATLLTWVGSATVILLDD